MQYTEVENVRSEQWNDVFMRWRLVNFLIDNGALEVENDMLVEVPIEEDELPEVQSEVTENSDKSASEAIGA